MGSYNAALMFWDTANSLVSVPYTPYNQLFLTDRQTDRWTSVLMKFALHDWKWDITI